MGWPWAGKTATSSLVPSRNASDPSSLKRQLPLANLRKILATKFFRITHQIHQGYASLFVKPFSSTL